jgi:tetratricopeptide (TPR) repeat protein
MISGEAGIGKTRLVEEVAAEAQLRGFHTAWGRCTEEGGAPPYWPWIQILRSYIEHFRDSPAGVELKGPDTETILAAMPGVVDNPPPLSRASMQDIVDGARREAVRFGLFDAISNRLFKVSAEHPLLMVFDDLHAADEASLSLLRFLAKQSGRGQMFILGTYRDFEVRLWPEREPIFAELTRIAESFRLGGMTESEVSELIRVYCGQTPDRALCERLLLRTNGNPFFVREIVRLMIAERGEASIETPSSHSFAIPDGVRVTIQLRFELLSPENRRILEVAAVVGRPFRAEELERIADADLETVLSTVEKAIVAGILAKENVELGVFRFSHPLFAESIYESLNPTLRMTLHLKIAETAESLYAKPDAAELAWHYSRALPLGCAERAVKFCRMAAERAQNALAYQDAASLYATALAALSTTPGATEEDRCELLLGLGESQYLAGQFDRFRVTFEEALEISRTLGNPRLFAQAVLGLDLLPYEAKSAHRSLVQLHEEALRTLGETETPLRVRLLAQLAECYGWLGWSGDHQSSELTTQAVVLARACNAPETLAEALFGRYFSLRGPDDLRPRLALSEELKNIVDANCLSGWSFRTRYYRGADLLEAGDELAWRELEELQCDKAARVAHVGIVEATEAMRAVMELPLDRAEALVQKAFEAGRERPTSLARQIFNMQTFVVCREQGRSRELEQSLERAVVRNPKRAFSRSALALVYAENGRPEEAIEQFDQIAATGFAGGQRDYQWLVAMSWLAEACVCASDSERAQQLYEVLKGYSDRLAVVGALLCLGSVSRYLGLLAGAASSFADAQRHFEVGLQTNRRMGSTLWMAHCQYECAALQIDHGGGEQAHKLLDDCLRSARALGYVRLIEAAEVLAARSSWSPEPPTSSSPQHETLTHQREATPALQPSSDRSGADAAVQNVFRREGDIWTITYQGQTLRLRDLKGLSYISRLLQNPGQEFHVLSLVTEIDAATGTETHEARAEFSSMSREQLAERNLRAGGLEDAGEMLDAQAKAAYASRLKQLREELEDAEEVRNPERVAKVEDEIEELSRELSRAVGRGGRDRRAGSSSERARLSVTRAIKMAIERSAQNHSRLAAHLNACIRTGAFCCYRPDPRSLPHWHF